MGRLSIAQVVGEATERVWSQVAIFPAGLKQGEVEISQMGVLVVALTIEGDDGGVVGHDILAKIQTQWSTGVGGLGDWVQRLLGTETGVESVVLGWFRNGEAEIVGYGLGGVTLQRGGKRGEVYRGVRGEWGAVRGPVKLGDRWLVGTGGLMGEMSAKLNEDIMRIPTIVQAGEELTTQVHAAEDNSHVAGLIIEVAQVAEVETTDPAVYLKQPVKRRKTALSVGLILLVLLGLSLYFGWQRRETTEWEKRYQVVVTQVEGLMAEAGQTALTDVVRAKQLTQTALEVGQKAEVNFVKKVEYKEKITALITTTKERAAVMLGEAEVKELPVWFDLNLLREGMIGTQLMLDKDKVLVLDGQKGAVGAVAWATKQAEMVGGGDLVKGAILMAAAGTRPVLWSSQGVIEINISTKTSSYLVKPDSEWERIVGVGMFGGNVYVVDAGSSEIWRYPGTAQGVGQRQRWLGTGVTADLSQAADMVIDGDVWVGIKNGEVKRFRRGAVEKFSISGLDSEITELAGMFTSEETKNVYLLDRQKTRVVALDKTGKFVKKYVWGGIAGVTDLVVVESEGKMYLLSGSSVYAMDL